MRKWAKTQMSNHAVIYWMWRRDFLLSIVETEKTFPLTEDKRATDVPKLLLLSLTLSFSLVLNCSCSTSSPHPPDPPICQQEAHCPSYKAGLSTHWQHAGDPLHSHHCSNMWGGWLTAAWSSWWIHHSVCFSWLQLFLFFPGVNSVTLVTQKPPVVTLRTGQTVNMDCNLGTVTNDAVNWYKQVPGGVPQFVLSFYHSWSSVEYGSGFSSPKFTCTYQSKSDYRLIISEVEDGDSAVYYCQTWDSSVSENVSQWFTLWQKPPHWILLLSDTLTSWLAVSKQLSVTHHM